jgi:hypothetical protein
MRTARAGRIAPDSRGLGPRPGQTPGPVWARRFDDEAHLAPNVRAHQLLNVMGAKPPADGKGRYGSHGQPNGRVEQAETSATGLLHGGCDLEADGRIRQRVEDSIRQSTPTDLKFKLAPEPIAFFHSPGKGCRWGGQVNGAQ